MIWNLDTQGVVITILAAVFSVLVLLEFVPSTIAMLGGMTAGRERLNSLTKREISRPVTVVIGVLDGLGCAGVVAGFWIPALAVAAGGYFAVLTAAILAMQIRGGDRGRALLAYGLFFSWSVLLITFRLLAS